MSVFSEKVNLFEVVEIVKERGYLFVADALTQGSLAGWVHESNGLTYEEGDHVTHPINKGKSNEVHQLHARSYHFLGDPLIPFTNAACLEIAQQVPLPGWCPTEIGFQRYRNSKEWISPHRDRRSDQLFSVTFTLAGSAWVHVLKANTDPPDYRDLTRVDSFLTQPGTAMFLRAPG